MLAFAGIPLYIHVPQYFAEEMGLGLGVLGIALLASRAVDSIQDPILGTLADRLRRHRELWAGIAGMVLALGIAVLFAPPAWGEPLPRLIVGLLSAFTGFSALQIILYDHGLAQAEIAGGGYTNISVWREAGGLVGICLAAAAPAVFAVIFGSSIAYATYAAAFAVCGLVVLGWMRGNWCVSGKSIHRAGFRQALQASGVIPLLIFGFVNVLPTAVTSTLFLFFVRDILRAEAHAGPVLLLFFACAAGAAPLWARLANRIGRKSALTIGMSLSIPTFIGAYLLGDGDVVPFYIMSAMSGTALGADMTLAPAMLAARIRGGGSQVFSLWTFLQKTALAVAAGITLPLLAATGYQPGSATEDGLVALAIAYAVVPCLLKLVAIPTLWIIVTE